MSFWSLLQRHGKVTTISSPLILLDTHVWLWYVAKEASLKEAAKEQIKQAINDGHAYFSAMTAWEICFLDKNNRINLDAACEIWIEDVIKKSGIQEVPVTRDIAVEANSLPGNLHKDPVDRILVATARKRNMILATRDGKILKYAEDGHLQVLES